ncbi:hypothetical protein cypCar_00005190 [Cyprinus carpio]|nr:hypothetical protein cypCar_00005190 [Cyprinus carpio]
MLLLYSNFWHRIFDLRFEQEVHTDLLELLLSCDGQGPSVSVMAAKLNFGWIPVLTDVTRTLQLPNGSPIPARFLAQM